MTASSPHIVVIGAGMGGLASAIRLGASGYRVTLIEAADTPGGKMRTVPSDAGPVDAGPTVLTMRHQFDDLFALAGERLDDHVDIRAEPLLARHWWRDGSSLDLVTDIDANRTGIARLSGEKDARAYVRFHRRAAANCSRSRSPRRSCSRRSGN